jgi:chaperonin GroEL
MPAKEILFRDEARHKILAGIGELAKAVKATLGPRGRNVVLGRQFGAPLITKDGVTVAKEIDLESRFENMGAQMVREVASKTNDEVGDGTTTAVVLAQAIYRAGLKNVVAGANPMDLKRGIDLAVEAVVKELKKKAIPVSGVKAQKQVATVSANGDSDIGGLIAEAMKQVGVHGVVTVEEAKSMETELEVVEGLEWDRGYLSPYFVTNQDQMEAVLEKPYILIHEKKISSINDLLPIMEKVANEGRPLLVVAEDVDGEALATLVVNKLRGTVQAVAVKAPAFGDRRKAILSDIAVLTGGRALTEDLGISFENIALEDLGQAKRVIVTKDNTTVIEGKGKKPAIQGKIRQIEMEIADSSSTYDQEKLQERLAKLTGGVAVIRVGAHTDIEMKALKARVEDALSATRAAADEGVVPGGGTALLRARKTVDRLAKTLEGDVRTGVNILSSVLDAPAQMIATNAGLEGPVVAGKILEDKTYEFGYNADAEKYQDLVKAGVIDPAKVVRVALQNAASVAGLLITTEAAIAELPEKAAPAMPGGGEYGDY